MKALLVVAVLGFCVLTVAAPVALAQTGSTERTTSPAAVSSTLGKFLVTLYETALRVVGLAIFTMFLYAGLMKMLPQVFKGNPNDIIKDAIIGLIVLVSAYVILNSIHPNLVNVGSSTFQPVPWLGTYEGASEEEASEEEAGMPRSSDLIERKAGTVTLVFLKSGAPCGNTNWPISCEPGTVCRGARCSQAGPDEVAMHAYCSQSIQCAGVAECVPVYEFRDNTASGVKKCCALDEIQMSGTQFYYCRN